MRTTTRIVTLLAVGVTVALAADRPAIAQETDDSGAPARYERTTPVALAALTNGGLAVVDPTTGKLVKKIAGLSDATFGVVVNPRNPAQAWATAEKSGQLFEIDLATGTVKGEPIALASDPNKASTHQPVTTGDGRHVIITTPGENTLTIVDTETRAVSKIPVNHDPHIVDIDQKTNQLFVSRRGTERGASFFDFEKLKAKLDFSNGVTLTQADLDALKTEGSFVPAPINGAPRVITALGNGRFALAMYGKRGPLIYEVKDGKATLLDDLDNVIEDRPRKPKANQEYLEAQAVSADGRTLVGTDQGIPPFLRVWEMDPETGMAVREVRAIPLPAEPYWVNLSKDGKTAWVTIPKNKDASGADAPGSVLTIDVETGKIVQNVPLAEAGVLNSPKRMVVVDLPARFLRSMTNGMTDALQGGGEQGREGGGR